jgi:dephospho-CoA kinase
LNGDFPVSSKNRLVYNEYHQQAAKGRNPVTKTASAALAPVLVITGGSGSGKSTVAAVFRRLGARVLDVDRIAHLLLKPGTPTWHEIVKEFCGARWQGPKLFRLPLVPGKFVDAWGRPLPELPWVLAPSGAIRRDRLGATVFANPAALQALNRITHPRLRRLLEQEIRGHRRRGVRPLVLDMAVYPEKIFRGLGDRVLWVRSPASLRARRLVRRLGLSLAAARARIRRQRPDREYRRVADVVLSNQGSLAGLRQAARNTWPRLLAKKRRGNP